MSTILEDISLMGALRGVKMASLGMNFRRLPSTVSHCRRGVLKCERRHDEASNAIAATIQNSGRRLDVLLLDCSVPEPPVLTPISRDRRH
jgi:hypothetical protein